MGSISHSREVDLVGQDPGLAMVQRLLNNFEKPNVKNQKTYNCNECSYTNTKRERLQMHINKVHRKTDKHNCPGCTSFSHYDKSVIQHHFNSVHLNIRRFKCSVCEFTGYVMFDVKKHMQKTHSKDGPILPIEGPANSKISVDIKRSGNINDISVPPVIETTANRKIYPKSVDMKVRPILPAAEVTANSEISQRSVGMKISGNKHISGLPMIQTTANRKIFPKSVDMKDAKVLDIAATAVNSETYQGYGCVKDGSLTDTTANWKISPVDRKVAPKPALPATNVYSTISTKGSGYMKNGSVAKNADKCAISQAFVDIKNVPVLALADTTVDCETSQKSGCIKDSSLLPVIDHTDISASPMETPVDMKGGLTGNYYPSTTGTYYPQIERSSDMKDSSAFPMDITINDFGIFERSTDMKNSSAPPIAKTTDDGSSQKEECPRVEGKAAVTGMY